MRRKTSKNRRYRHQVKVLKSEVMSPRIAWFTFLGFLKTLSKLALLVGVGYGIFYGVNLAIEHTFHKNPDFRLQAIELNQNDVLDEVALVEFLDIDLTGNIFEFEIPELKQQLLEIPAISTAKVDRNLPGTLRFHLTTREPIAWLSCPDELFPDDREPGNLLVDHTGFVFPCPPLMAAKYQQLPILLLESDPTQPIVPGELLEHSQYKHCVSLLKSILSHMPESISNIESISQDKPWSLNVLTRSGTLAVFGLSNHPRQLDYLNQALQHSENQGYQIATINLIPKQNVPITIVQNDSPPRAIPVQESELEAPVDSRQNSDLQYLLNRN